MPIECVHIGNFKGIATASDLDIKPITVFVGANSSGKSSCIHALAALSQTVKITNDSRPLVLDDEFATVHLGRFIEIIHSRSYQDLIELGVGLSEVEYQLPAENGKKEPRRFKVKAKAILRFKCTKRTQEVHLDSAQFDVGDEQYNMRRLSSGAYSLAHGTTKHEVYLSSAFFLSPATGFDVKNPEEYFKLMPLLRMHSQLRVELSKTLYLGPFRQGPLRRYATRGGGPTEVGPMGEGTVTMLANETIQSRTRTHIKQITKWLKDLGLARSVDITRVGQSDLFDVSMTLQDGAEFPLADLGYGLSQILPVLTQCSFASKGATLLFEQPEIHLHTIVARALADVFIETAREKGVRIVIETHSPELVQGFMVRQREKALPKDDFVAYRVTRENGQSITKALKFDEFGDIDENWEKGISVP